LINCSRSKRNGVDSTIGTSSSRAKQPTGQAMPPTPYQSLMHRKRAPSLEVAGD
jgi:hypothetical protein